MAYLLDANIFIQAKNLYYGFDFCPAFWDWLIRKNHNGVVYSIERVADELVGGEDLLSDWATERGSGFWLSPDASTLPALGTIAEWITSHPHYSAAAKNTFLQIADYYLVAQALAGRHVVVSHEKPENSIHRVKIPSVCIAHNIKHVTPYEMLRLEKARFVLPDKQTQSSPTTLFEQSRETS